MSKKKSKPEIKPVSLRQYLNNKIKSKGSTLAKEKAKGKKYTSIAAAKKAGSLYYMKNGKLMAAVYKEDLKKPLEPTVAKSITRSKITVTGIGSDDPSILKLIKDVEKALSGVSTKRRTK